MALADIALQVRARRAYETGRVLLGLRLAAFVLPMAALSLFACDRPAATAAVAGALAPLVVAFVWRGQTFGCGARIGLLAVLPPLLVPVLVRATVHACGTSLCPSYGAVCLGSGVVGGALLGLWAVRRGVPGSGLVTAGVVACLTGTLGCLIAGAAGLLGLTAGLAVGSAPALALSRYNS